MKLGFFDDYKLGVVKGDNIVDVSRTSQRIRQHRAAGQIAGVIENWGTGPAEARGGRGLQRRRADVQRPDPGA